MNAQQKFRLGKELDGKEIMDLNIVDRCRYVVDSYFKKGFSADEVHLKLVEINPLNELFTPMEIYDALCEYYGKP